MKTIRQIAIESCLSSDPLFRLNWIDGFLAGAEYKYTRGHMRKPVDVFLKGILVGTSESLEAAEEVSGLSKSSVWRLLQNGKKSKSGYSFGYGTNKNLAK